MRSFAGLCAARTLLDTRWGTRAAPHVDTAADTLELRPRVQYYRPSGADEEVWRIKLEYVRDSRSPYENCLIESLASGGVRTLDIHTGAVLWSTGAPDARPYPHLEFADGWLVFDRDAPGHFEVWRSARLVPDAREAHRGEFVRYTILDVPEMVRAYRLQFPTLALYVARSHSVTIHDTYAEMDVRAKSLVRSLPLADTLHAHRNIHYIEFDEAHLFLVGFGYNRVSILSRESGAVLWTLGEHIRTHGAPECYRSAPLRPDERHALLLREQVRVPPPRWLTALAHWAPHDPAQLAYAWHAVHADRDTDTLVVLGESGLLLLPAYHAMLRGEPTPPARMHLFATERDARLVDEEDADDLLDALRFRRRPRAEMHGQLSVANGRVAAVFETFTLLDLHAPTRGRDTAHNALEVPFAVYEWSDLPNAFDWYAGPIDQFRGCSCVQMDATGVYCVTRQALDREVGVTPADFPEGYQEACIQHDSSMVTGFHFDTRAEPPAVLAREDITRARSPAPDPLEQLVAAELHTRSASV